MLQLPLAAFLYGFGLLGVASYFQVTYNVHA